jgi:hypothetical protein
MTATSVLHTGPVTTAKTWLRLAAALFVIVVLSLGAFAIGRTTAPTHTRPVIVPAPASAPAVPSTPPYLRRLGRAF